MGEPERKALWAFLDHEKYAPAQGGHFGHAGHFGHTARVGLAYC